MGGRGKILAMVQRWGSFNISKEKGHNCLGYRVLRGQAINAKKAF